MGRDFLCPVEQRNRSSFIVRRQRDKLKATDRDGNLTCCHGMGFWQFFTFFDILSFQWCSDFVRGHPRTEKFVPGFLLLSLSWDKGTGGLKKFLPWEKGTTRCPFPVCPWTKGQGDIKKFCSGKKGQQEIPSQFVLGRPGTVPSLWKPYTANVCRDLQWLCGEIGVRGFQIYGDCMYTHNPCNFWSK